MPRILVSNDDGYDSEGIQTLYRCAESLGNAWLVAPDREQSGSGQGITLHQPLRVHQKSEKEFSVEGTPADCVKWGLHHLLVDHKADLVLSGINYGRNIGTDVLYSGTVSAAREAALVGIPAIALSFATDRVTPPRFDVVLDFIKAFGKWVLANHAGEGVLYNVNFPPGQDDPNRPHVFCHLAHHGFNEDIEVRKDPRGRQYYWIGGELSTEKQAEGTDIEVLREGKISITPLELNLTRWTELEKLRGSDVTFV